MKFTLKEIILIGIFAALTAILAQVSINIPISPVPITLQIFAVFFSAAILGSKCGAFSQIIYILLGAFGVPVFAGFKGGLGVILGPTGGYIISFPIVALVIGLIMERRKLSSRVELIGIMVIGLIICYILGTVQLAFVLKLSVAKAITVAVAPYLPLDIIKIVVAAYLGYQVRHALVKANLLNVKTA